MKLNEVKRQVIKEDFKPGDRVRFTSPRNATEDGVVVRTLDSSATEVKFDSGEKRGVFTSSLTLLKEAKDIRLLERQLIAIEKKMSAKDDPCWKGYHMVGTKNKNGREVPNCVPGKKGVAEGVNEAEETVRFVLDSERAYQAVMAKFGDMVSWDDNDYMIVPARIWPKVEQVAHDADGIGAERVDDSGPENPEHYGVAEGAEFGSNYAEQLAQKVFDANPGISNEDAILNAGYAIAKKEMGSRANGIFRDEDFPSDFVSAYGWLQDQRQQGVAEAYPGHIQKGKELDAATRKIQTNLDKRIKKVDNKDKKGVTEGTSNIGNKIKALYQKIYDQGDDSIDYMYHESPVFAQYWDEYEGDLDSIVSEVDPSELQIIHDELKAYLQGPGLAEGVAETMSMSDAVKLLRKYGADHFKTTTNELHFYKNGKAFSVDLIMNKDTTRSVTISSLNAARRGLTGQGVAEGANDLRDSVLEVLKTIYNGASTGEDMIDTLADEFGQYYDEVEASGDQSLQNAYRYMMDNGQEAESNPKAMAKIASDAISMLTQGVAEGAEHDQSHGSPYDRGAADSYYHRPRRPHKGGVGGGSGEESTKLTPEEIKAYHAGYDWNERHGDKKIWDSKDNNQSVSETNEPGDVRTKFALQKARSQFPMAGSDAEALALYINRKEQKDVDDLGAENDYEDMMIDQLSTFDDKIDKEVDELQQQIDQLKRHAGIKSESVVEGSAENMIKHVKDARAFMNSSQPEPKPINRAGYNTINSKDEWLEKIHIMQQVQNDPGLKNDAEAQEAIRQRIGDLNKVGIKNGWVK